MEPKNHLKLFFLKKKGIENYFFFLLVPFGAQGVPGITFEWILAPFLKDVRMISSKMCVHAQDSNGQYSAGYLNEPSSGPKRIQMNPLRRAQRPNGPK